ncbi:MAG: GNAT family N-acetyltransferase [Achromobacter sp.]
MDANDPVLTIETSLDAFTAQEWNALAGMYPFMQHGFLSALHDTGCASTRTGWTPYFLALRQNDRLVGAMPLYVKAHSRGEYVFDYAWADAFARHGLAYYPKLLCAVPFTPVSGPRLLAHTHEHRVMLARGAIALARHHNIASLHILFTHAADVEALSQAGFMLREGVQFHWRNAGYPDMDAFLMTMSHDKRKKIKQDRRRVADAGVSFAWLQGATLDEAALDFFYRCYAQTYYDHGNPPYLSRACFARWHAEMPEQLLLIMAYRDGEPVACALDVVADGVVYGRYWGTQAFISGLHFETCYMQSIAYCIAHGHTAFEGGAQGEHKMARGLLPTPTWSAHWIADERFAEAISDFLDRETEAVDAYIGELEQHTPFKKSPVA